MDGHDHESRLDEWAALIGASVPESAGGDRPCDPDGDA